MIDFDNCIEWEYPRVAYSLISDRYYPSRESSIAAILTDWDSEVALLVVETFATIARLEVSGN